MPQPPPPENVIPSTVCPFWADGKHLFTEVKQQGHVVAKECACEQARVLTRLQ